MCKEHLLHQYKKNRKDLIFMIILYIITLVLIYTAKDPAIPKAILYVMATIFDGTVIYTVQKSIRKY